MWPGAGPRGRVLDPTARCRTPWPGACSVTSTGCPPRAGDARMATGGSWDPVAQDRGAAAARVALLQHATGKADIFLRSPADSARDYAVGGISCKTLTRRLPGAGLAGGRHVSGWVTRVPGAAWSPRVRPSVLRGEGCADGSSPGRAPAAFMSAAQGGRGAGQPSWNSRATSAFLEGGFVIAASRLCP